MKKIRIDFVDFEKEFEKKDNFIYKVLIKYYDVEISDNPDYLFFSVFSDDNLCYDCVKIFYTGENLCPNFNICDYAIGYEYMDYQDRYFRLPYYMRNENACKLMGEKHIEAGEELAARKFCNFVYSNEMAHPIRQQFFERLSGYKQIDSGGRYLNNIGGPCRDKLQFQRNYKFSIAFENSSHPGYTTEKIVDAFAARTIPIYWGDQEIEKVFNPKAFVRLRDEQEIDEVVQKIRELDSNDMLYMKMLKQPALLRPEFGFEGLQVGFEQFLKNIFNQELEQAYRRNRVFWGKMYQDKMLQYYNDHKELLSYKIKISKIIPFKGIRNGIKKIMGRGMHEGD